MSKPSLLFYCQHSVGMGHLVRSLALAEGLSRDFDVHLLLGGELPAGVHIAKHIDVLPLPPLHMDDQGALHAAGHDTLTQSKRSRHELIQSALARIQPRCVLVELFPFGRKKFAFELLPLLRNARREYRSLVVCSVRDLLVTDRADQQRHDARAAMQLNALFDAVLVHADPRFARLQETFSAHRAVRVPLLYSGFVSRHAAPVTQPVQNTVLVSAGGGKVGAPLLTAALAAAPRIKNELGLNTRLIAGPLLPDAAFALLAQQSAPLPFLQIEKFVPELAVEIARARVSVSQCGYNTAMDLLATGTRAVVVPFADGGENEQSERAQRLAVLGRVQVVTAADLSAHSLFAGVRRALASAPAAVQLNTQGAQHSNELLRELLAQRVAQAQP